MLFVTFALRNLRPPLEKSEKQSKHQVMDKLHYYFAHIVVQQNMQEKNLKQSMPVRTVEKLHTRLISSTTRVVNVFCSQSCAATYNNTGRKRSEETKAKISESVKKSESLYTEIKTCPRCNSEFKTSISNKKYCSVTCAKNSSVKSSLGVSSKRDSNRKDKVVKNRYCKIEFSNCKECGLLFVSKKGSRVRTKYCSDSCNRKAASKRQSERLSKTENRSNLGRHRMSYMEKAFKDWLEHHDVDFRFEPKFKNNETGRYYYPDFVFDDKKLIIELDGTQHNKTQEKDAARDAYIFKTYGYLVIRITHREFVKKTRLSEIKEWLGIED